MTMKFVDSRGTPNWYLAMQEFEWTVRRIMRTFAVPRTIARDIQHTHPPYEDALRIVCAHRELIDQIGH